MRTAGAILRKDLVLELRTLETLPSMALLSVVTFVIFHFALNRNSLSGQLAAGVFTVTLLFAAMLAVNRLFVAEREQGGFDAFLLAPVDRTAMLVAKATALLIFMVVLEVIAVPAFALLLAPPRIGHSLPGADPDPAAGRHRVCRDRDICLSDRHQYAGARPDRADDRAAAVASRADRDSTRDRSAAEPACERLAAGEVAGRAGAL